MLDRTSSDLALLADAKSHTEIAHLTNKIIVEHDDDVSLCKCVCILFGMFKQESIACSLQVCNNQMVEWAPPFECSPACRSTGAPALKGYLMFINSLFNPTGFK